VGPWAGGTDKGADGGGDGAAGRDADEDADEDDEDGADCLGGCCWLVEAGAGGAGAGCWGPRVAVVCGGLVVVLAGAEGTEAVMVIREVSVVVADGTKTVLVKLQVLMILSITVRKTVSTKSFTEDGLALLLTELSSDVISLLLQATGTKGAKILYIKTPIGAHTSSLRDTPVGSAGVEVGALK